jgi:hypothetical protein
LIVVDPHKDGSVVQVTDFYGKVLLPPKAFSNTAPELEAMVATIKQCLADHHIIDAIGGVERTGRYHGPVRRTLRRHWDVKMIHPYATKQLRQPASPGVKTDEVDLDAMTRAMITGYGREEPELPLLYSEWRAVNRMREDLVCKRTALKAQCQEKIQANMPGYSRLFGDLWDSEAALQIACLFGSPVAVKEAGAEKILRRLRRRGIRVLNSTVEGVLYWSTQAADPDPTWKLQRRLLRDCVSLLDHLTRHIGRYEVELLRRLVQAPAVRLLVTPGINVVSCAGYGSELGPISDYLNPRRITGRAGLFGGRYQTADTDRPQGLVLRGHNLRLRDATMEVARNLLQHNSHYRAWGEFHRQKGWKPSRTQAAVANRFARLSHAMLNDRPVNDHPCLRRRDSVLGKIFRFCHDYNLDQSTTQLLTEQALAQLPRDWWLHELNALQQGAWHSPSRRKPDAARRQTPTSVAAVIARLWELANPSNGGTESTTAQN